MVFLFFPRWNKVLACRVYPYAYPVVRITTGETNEIHFF